MPQDGSNNYYYPPGTPGIPDQTIESEAYNTFLDDLVEHDLNIPRPIHRGGTGASNVSVALINLTAEKATHLVTNYDAHTWLPGSFRSTNAVGQAAPVDGHAFAGICYLNEPLTNPPANQNVIVSARDMSDTVEPGRVYVRQKVAGVWGEWSIQAGSISELNDLYVNITGDTMTGPLVVGGAVTAAGTVTVNDGVVVINDPEDFALQINAGAEDYPHAQIQLNTGPDGAAQIISQREGVNRWLLSPGDAVDETGSGNTGSNFKLVSCNDAGDLLYTALSIERSNGLVTLADDPIAPLHAATKQYVDGALNRNLVINGQMWIDNRIGAAAPPIMSTTPEYSSIDRWATQGTTQHGTERILTGLADFPYALRVRRNVGATTTVVAYVGQVIESWESSPMAGSSVTLSFYVTKGANFSASGGMLTAQIVAGTGLDQGWAALRTGAWTGAAVIGSATPVITATKTRFTVTAEVPATTRELAVQFSYAGTGAAAANDYFEITGVQLQKGTVATDFDRLHYSLDENRAQRFFRRIRPVPTVRHFTAEAVATTTSFIDGWFQFNDMRVIPTLMTSNVASHYSIGAPGFNEALCTDVPIMPLATRSSCRIRFTRAGHGIPLQTHAFINSNPGVLLLNSEL